MKYKDLVFKILDKEKWRSTSDIKKQAESSVKKSINWYSIHYVLEDLLKDGKVERIQSNKITLWRKKGKTTG